MIQPNRHIDVIFAVDSSADTSTNYPNGSALVKTYERTPNVSSGSALSSIANGTTFPFIPDTNTFINLGLNSRPTFFGCNASNTTTMTPLVVYLPMAPYIYTPNTSTTQLAYNNSQRDAIVANGFAVATMGNGSLDAEWPVCAGCAILSRSFGRTNTSVPDACTKCFSRYCWDGSLNSTNPGAYNPALKEENLRIKTSGAAGQYHVGGFGVLATFLVAALTGLLYL